MPANAPGGAPGGADAAAITHVFFDAEGTLWLPRPGRSFADFWSDPRPERAHEVFRLTPGVRAALRTLRSRGLRLIVMSLHDVHVLPALLDAFGLRRHFDDVLVNGHKGARILQWLNAHDLAPENALMVGDRVDLDIAPVESFGIRAVLLDRPYNRGVPAIRVHDIRDVPALVAFASHRVAAEDPAHATVDEGGTWTALAPMSAEG